MIEHIRSYEVSIWTLQDSFITVLKPSNLEPKGQIQEPHMGLKDSNDNTFSFKIPMYLNAIDGTFVENPIWFTTRNGNIIANMRKVKVIFNKGEVKNEQVFEFIITNVKEEHEGFAKYCEVECEGLAFHELGKQGYRITLSGADDVDYDQQQWAQKSIATRGAMPYPNLNYWADKILKNSSWIYSVCMDWSAQDGIVDNVDYMAMDAAARKAYNDAREAQGYRRRDTIYEDAYVSSWSKPSDESVLTPSNLEPQREKYRLIEDNESNRYNLCQTLAETFQVFVKYVYHYDDNYHIVGREVVFYNNFLNEHDGVIDFTYKYNTKSLTREMDSTDLTSKMFVKPLSDEDAISGSTVISDTDANKSLEDYILNFDYLYHIGTISEEQYAEIPVFEANVRALNEQLIELEDDIILLQNQLPELEATRDNALAATALDLENIESSNSLLNNLTNDTGIIVVDADMGPQTLYLLKDTDSDTYYVNLRTEGIIPNTVRLWYTYTQATRTLSDEVPYFTRQLDEFGNLNKITNLLPKGDSTRVYATFSYRPQLKYENVIRTYENALNKDTATYNSMKAKAESIKTEIETKQAQYDTLMADKEKLLADFERLMGPALREGTWQPENEYAGYGDFYSEEVTLGAQSAFSDSMVSIGWDSEPFDGEQLNYYELGILREKTYYPCIDLSNILSNFSDAAFLEQMSFIYNDTNAFGDNDPRAFQYFPIGSRAQLGFIRQNSNADVIPVLFLTGAEQVNDWSTFTNNARLGVVNATVEIDPTTAAPYVKIDIDNEVRNLQWINNPQNYEVVYPRIQIASPFMKTGNDQISVQRTTSGKEKILDAYSDYSVLYRDKNYYITLAPQAIVGAGVFANKYNTNVTISNTALAIYLDALQVLKENSIPKASYTIEPAMTDKTFTHNAYARIAQLAHINDYELKFENVMGYISELDLDLDMPKNDKATIKNYKTKFEDLFSSIVAQTEAMKKNSYVFGLVSNAFDANGTLNSSIINSIVDNINFDGIIYKSAFARAAEIATTAADNKAALANSTAMRVMNGDLGLAFASGSGITSVKLTHEDGLLIEGYLDKAKTLPGFFRVTNGAMGFFKKVNGAEMPSLYFENGDLALSGTVYASNGWFGADNGWIIGNGKTVNGTTYQGGLLYSANQRIIFAAGTGSQNPSVAFYNASGSPLLAYDGSTLSINGNGTFTGSITASTGYIGNWLIGTNALTSGSGKVGMSSTYSGDGSGNVMFWAGNATAASAPFRVYGNGAVTATSADITGTIRASNLYIGNTKATFSLDSNGKITLGSVSGTGNLAQLTMTNGYMNLSSIGGSSGISSSSNVRIGPNGIYLASSGYLVIDAGNFKINSAGNVTVTGSVTATDFTITGITDKDGNAVNVGNALKTLLQYRTDSEQADDQTATYFGMGRLVSSWSNGNWLKVVSIDGTVTKISFGNSAKLAQARRDGRNDIINSLSVGMTSPNYHEDGYMWRVPYTLSADYMTTKTGYVSVSMNYVYTEARKGYTKDSDISLGSTATWTSSRQGNNLIVYCKVTLNKGSSSSTKEYNHTFSL